MHLNNAKKNIITVEMLCKSYIFFPNVNPTLCKYKPLYRFIENIFVLH